jgi:hypothetical protein
VHAGLLSVFVTGAVALVRSIGSVAISAPAASGQSRLVVPKSGRLNTVPLPSQARPLRVPPLQVPGKRGLADGRDRR